MGVLVWAMVFLIASEVAYKVVMKKASNGAEGGKQKVMMLLPLLPLFLYLPWLPSSCHIRTLVAMVFLWTAPCKLLLLCFNKPLDPLPPSFSHFLVATFLPIHISSLSAPPLSQKASSSGYGFVGKLLVLVGILNTYSVFSHIPSPLLYFLYCCHFYLGLDLCLGAIATIVERGFSIRLYAQFNEPLKSAGLAEFWGRRWNLTINCILKETVYKPLLKSPLRLHAGPAASKALALLATFATSGLLHELIFVYVSQSPPTGEMTAFFLLHGFATLAQLAICERWPALRGLPTWICRALTLSFLYATVSLFFLRPLRRSKTDVQAIREFHYLQSTLLNFLGFSHYQSGLTL